MRNEIEDLKQQAREYAKQQLKKQVKEAAKKVGKQIWAAIAPILPWVIAAILIFIVIVGCIDWGNAIESDSQDLASASSSSWKQFIKFLHSWEGGGKIYNINGVDCYKVLPDGGGGSAVGYGVDIAANGNKLKDENGELYNTDIGSYIPVNVVDAIETQELENFKALVEESFTAAGVQCTEYQFYALISFVYNNGPASISRFCEGIGMGNAYKEYYTVNNNSYYEQKDKFDENLNEFTKTFMAWNTGGLLTGRRRSELCLFETGYYGYDLPYNGHGMDEYWQESYVRGEEGGGYKTDTRDYVFGTFTSSITGKTFIIINQNGYMGNGRILPGQCNRAAGATILSGYYSGTAEQLITKTQSEGGGFPYASSALYAGSDLTVTNASGNISNYQSYVKEQLKKGNYILIRFSKPTTGKSGSTWSSNDGHWFSILGYKQEDGKDKIFTGEPAWNNNKWYDIDEFENVKENMQYLYLVTPTK